MSTVYEAIQDCVLSEEGGAIVKDAEGRAYNALRSIQEQNRFILSTEYEAVLRPDEDRWMEERFSSTPEAKHSGKGKRHGWKYRTYMPKKYWNARTLICRAIDKGVDITGMGKSELQNVLSGKKDSDSSTETTSTNLDKFKKGIIKLNSYYLSMDIEDKVEARDFFMKSGRGWCI